MSELKIFDNFVKKQKLAKIKPFNTKKELIGNFSWNCLDGNLDYVKKNNLEGRLAEIKEAEKQVNSEFHEFIIHALAEERLFSHEKKRRNPEKKTLTLAGGAYTYFFFIPQFLAFIKKHYPLLIVTILMIEFRDIDDYPSDIDIVFAGAYDADPFFNFPNTFNTKVIIEDEVHLIIAKNLYEKYDRDPDIIIKNVPLIQINHFNSFSSQKKIANPKFYQFFEKFKKSKITVNTYYLGYELMLAGVGMIHGFASMIDQKGFVFLTNKPFATMERYFLYNNDCDEFVQNIIDLMVNNIDKIISPKARKINDMHRESFVHRRNIIAFRKKKLAQEAEKSLILSKFANQIKKD